MFKKYPSLYLLIPVVLGIITADQFRLPSWFLLGGCLALTLVGVAFLTQNKNNTVAALFGLALFCFAGYNFSIKFYSPGPNHIANFVSEKDTFQIFGSVADWPILKANRTDIKIRVDSLGRESRTSVKGAILLRISDTTTALQRGDHVEFRGTIYPLKSRENPGSFDYARYLQLQGMFGTVYLTSLLEVRVDKSRRFGLVGLVDKLRAKIITVFEKNLSPPAAALASGILIGETRYIPSDIYRHFRDSGTLHLLAVSGSNVALVLIFLVLVLLPFGIGRKKRAMILMAAVLVFALLSYGEPSVVRASIMATLVLLATILERRYDLNQIIATAALVILLFDPSQLFNVGFQLSFVTAWGLIFIVPQIAKLFQPVQHRFWYRWLVLPVLISLVAQLCSAPLIAYYFGRVPAITAVANLFIIPLVSAAVVGDLVLLSVNLIWPLLGQFVGSLLNSFMDLIFYFLKIFGEEQSVVLKTGDMSVPAVIILYVFIISLTLILFDKSIRKIAIATIVAILNISLAFSLVSATSLGAHKQYLDLFSVPGGIAAVVTWSPNASKDLVVTGIYGRNYPIDERIFEPAFDKWRLEKVKRLFVLSAEYDGMDDILRLAQKYHVEEVFIDYRISKSFADQAAHLSVTAADFKISHFTQYAPVVAKPGFYPQYDCLTIDFGESEVRILNNFAKEDKLLNSAGRPLAAIIDNRGGLNTVEISDVLASGIDKLICSKINHSSKAMNINMLSEDWLDLDHHGACRLLVPQEQEQSFRFESIR